jgi:hypothetical protein
MADQKSDNLFCIIDLERILVHECCRTMLSCCGNFFKSPSENKETKAPNSPALQLEAPNPPDQEPQAPPLKAPNPPALEPQASPLKAIIEFLEIENDALKQKIEEDREKQKVEIEKQKAEILKKFIAEAEIDVFKLLCDYSYTKVYERIELKEEIKEKIKEKINLLYASAIFKAKIKNEDQEAIDFLKELRPDQNNNIHINYTEILGENINKAKKKSFLKEVFEGNEPADEYRLIDKKTLRSILLPREGSTDYPDEIELKLKKLQKQQLTHLKYLAGKMEEANPNPIIKKWQNILREDEVKVHYEIERFYQEQEQNQKLEAQYQKLEEAFSNYYEENKSDDCSIVFGKMGKDSCEKIGKNFLKLKFFSINYYSEHKIEEAKKELITLLSRDKNNNDLIKDLNSGYLKNFIKKFEKKVDEEMRSNKVKKQEPSTDNKGNNNGSNDGNISLEEEEIKGFAEYFASEYSKKTARKNKELKQEQEILNCEKIKEEELTKEKIQEESKLPKSILLRIRSAVSLILFGEVKKEQNNL